MIKINTFFILGMLISLVIGYIIGYRLGKQEGKKEGILFTPIFLRKKSLEEGNCVLCKNNKNSQFLQEKHDSL